MADIDDMATDRELLEREFLIKQERQRRVTSPDVDCKTTCPDSDKHGQSCEDYAACLADWQRIQNAKIRNGG